MKHLQKILWTTLTVVLLSAMWSCGEEDPEETPGRPGTEQSGGNNNGGNTGNTDNKDDNGDKEENKPAPVVKFNSIKVLDLVYNHATIEVDYTLENVDASTSNKIVFHKAGREDELEESIYAEDDLDLSGHYSYETYLNEKLTYFVRFDIVVGDQTFKSEVVTFVAPEKPYIAVANISLSQNKMVLKVGDKEPLYAFINPKEASNKGVRWYYNNPEIARSFHGVITIPAKGDASTVVEGVKPGTTTIVAESVDGEFRAECEVVVEGEEEEEGEN